MASPTQFQAQVEREPRRSPVEAPDGRPRTALLTRRSLRTALGILWLLDGVLQLQSFMFTKGFAEQVVAPSAAGQPSFVAGPVEWNVRMIASHPALLNGLFASVQLTLGCGLLFRRTARLAIVASIAWAAGVWYLGEGMGGLAGGTSTALNGAPGAAVLYLVLALAAWPESLDVGDGLGRLPHLRPPRWLHVVWAVLWVGFAGLNLLPTNVPPRVTSSQLAANAAMVPPWLAAIDRWMASIVATSGYGALTIVIALELCIGLLVFGNRTCHDLALWAGILVAGLFWAVGQSFGQLFSGQATDPSTGPLLILIGLAALGATRPEVSEASGLLRRESRQEKSGKYGNLNTSNAQPNASAPTSENVVRRVGRRHQAWPPEIPLPCRRPAAQKALGLVMAQEGAGSR